MITIRCSKCRKKLLKYRKIGKGRILRCYYDRIEYNNTIKKDNLVYCSCGNIIGECCGNFIKMKDRSFTYSGKVVKN